jgi:hypothetical protein
MIIDRKDTTLAYSKIELCIHGKLETAANNRFNPAAGNN